MGIPKQVPVKRCMSLCFAVMVFSANHQNKFCSPDMHVRLLSPILGVDDYCSWVSMCCVSDTLGNRTNLLSAVQAYVVIIIIIAVVVILVLMLGFGI
jgi:hypothetical protein